MTSELSDRCLNTSSTSLFEGMTETGNCFQVKQVLLVRGPRIAGYTKTGISVTSLLIFLAILLMVAGERWIKPAPSKDGWIQKRPTLLAGILSQSFENETPEPSSKPKVLILVPELL